MATRLSVILHDVAAEGGFGIVAHEVMADHVHVFVGARLTGHQWDQTA